MNLKQNTSNQTNEIKQLPPVLAKLKREASGFTVPDGYFDSLSPRIVDEIKKQENKSLSRAIIPQFSKSPVWKSALAVMIFAAMVVSYILVKKESVVPPATDEWTQINMAYDASYAEEALLAESYSIDKELENSSMSKISYATTKQNEPTVDEITNYLKDQDIDIDILNEY